MKKRFLIAVLPALMVLAGCAGVKAQPKANAMLEDTDAHAEMFGGAGLAFDFNVRKQSNNENNNDVSSQPVGGEKSVDPLKKPKIGVQYLKDGSNYAIRYVAAIASLDVEAYWTRGISYKTSSVYKAVGTNDDLIATKAYEKVNDNGKISEAKDEGDGYNYYVVYTLRNIPSNDIDSFLAAYLTISDGVNSPVYSDVVAARLGGGHEISFPVNKAGGYFLGGKIGGQDNQIVDLNDSLGEGSTDKAKKLSVPLSANDEFGYFIINSNGGLMSSFQYYGYSTFNNQTYYFEKSGDSDMFKARVNGTYNVYVNGEFHFWADCTAADVTLYLKPNSNWLQSTPKFAVYYISDSTFHGLTECDSTNHIFKLEHFDFIAHPLIIFTRHNNTIEGFTWTKDNNFWNQTNDIRYDGAQEGKETGNDNPAKSMYTVNADTWDKGGGSWSIYTPAN